MKELSIEEKARRYDEALERAKEWFKPEEPDSYTCIVESIFPELKESEDARMIKSINRLISHYYDVNFPTPEGFTREELVSWLEKQGEQPKKNDVCNNCDQQGSCVSPCPMKLVEKQGEQKPAWSKEDEKMLENIIKTLYNLTLVEADGQDAFKKELAWLKSLKDRVQPQPKQEWSEEDEHYLFLCSQILREYNTSTTINSEVLINWIKSLRPQNWTKEDKERYISCLQKLSTGNPEQPETINSKWFKEHVYPQPS